MERKTAPMREWGLSSATIQGPGLAVAAITGQTPEARALPHVCGRFFAVGRCEGIAKLLLGFV